MPWPSEVDRASGGSTPKPILPTTAPQVAYDDHASSGLAALFLPSTAKYPGSSAVATMRGQAPKSVTVKISPR